jgi:hypothetical protein
MAKRRVIGWKLPPAERASLIGRFPPAYVDVIADHVTLANDTSGRVLFPKADKGEIVGLADDGHGVQALVVAIGGTTDRPDGSTYHITWSLDKARGRTAQESNDVIRDKGWTKLDAVPVSLIPGIVG